MDTYVHIICVLYVILCYRLTFSLVRSSALIRFYVAVIKGHSGQKQLGMERVYFSLHISVRHLGKPGQKLKA